MHSNCKGFSARNRKFKQFFRRPKTGDLKKKKRSSLKLQGNSSSFSSQKQVIFKKKRSSKRHEIRCQSTKNTNLGLDLHSSSSEPVNFFGAQSSLGGDTVFVWGCTAPVCLPVAPGLQFYAFCLHVIK